MSLSAIGTTTITGSNVMAGLAALNAAASAYNTYQGGAGSATPISALGRIAMRRMSATTKITNYGSV